MKKFIAILAVIANLLLAIGKIIVGTLSKSAAIIADGINSGTDVIASVISFIGIKIAEKPADKKHPYGHGQAEFISGLVITLIIFISGGWIIIESIQNLISPSKVSLSTLAFAVIASSAIINGLMSQLKIYYGKKYDSVSLITDGIHSRIDLLVSLGIFLGLFLTSYYPQIDSIIALLVGLYILREAFYLGKETTDSLLGANAGQEIENRIKDIINTNQAEITNLKTQKIGNRIFAEIEIKLPSKLKIKQADEITKNLQKQLTEKIKNLEYVAIQIKSHDISGRYYKHPMLGKGFGWRKQEKSEKTQGAGPGGYCVCPKGDYKVQHKSGIPCKTMKCPKHNINLVRENKNATSNKDKKNFF
jgi:cation diffusion facilitator family transporter